MAWTRTKKGEQRYSIQLVARATGVTADTLRMWERRYGYPAPDRDDRGNRLYTEADIERLTQIKRALQAGARPQDAVPRPPHELAAMLERVAEVQARASSSNEPITGLLEALQRADAPALRTLLRKAAYSVGPARFVTEVAAPFTQAIGSYWASSRIDVHMEHLASSILSSQLEALLASFDETGDPIVLLATLPGEHHTLGLLMAAVYVATEGASSRYLGADLPPDQMLKAAEIVDAAAIAVSVSPAADPHAVKRDLLWMLDSMPKRRELWAGGMASRNLDIRDGRFRALPGWDDLSLALSRLRKRS